LNKVIRFFFASTRATRENATDPTLKTHVYKLTFEETWKETLATLNKMPGYKVVHEEKPQGEILLEKRTKMGRVMDITVTLFSVSPVRTAVDIYSASRGTLGDLGANYRNIQTIYQELDRKMPVEGK
jgi:uncharacterized protein (DUF1499 family)